MPKNAPYFLNQVRFGAGIGLNYGYGCFCGTVVPRAVYIFDKAFAIAKGLILHLIKKVCKHTILGGCLIGLFKAVNELRIFVEIEGLHVKQNLSINLGLNKYDYCIPALFF
ncbi:hypothetical protein [Gelatiniphilus marinus]|uniref:Uncharacterized protein n=1 Tax=Gelatiniphilus marinus TaxID=1759464 RepID=A0ABW5JX92_9FLAO